MAPPAAAEGMVVCAKVFGDVNPNSWWVWREGLGAGRQIASPRGLVRRARHGILRSEAR